MRKHAKDVEETADLLHGAAIRLLRHLRKEDTASGVPSAQLSALSMLVFSGPQTMGTLAVAEQMRPPSMSQLVDALERKGLAVRRPIDRRSIQVSATEKGRRLLEASRQRRLERLTQSLSDFPATKLAVLRDAADLMLAATKNS